MGEALIDFIPAQRDCLLKEVESFTRVCGGAPANVAAAAAKLGGESRMVTQLGKDAFGDYIVDTLQDAGVDTSCILRTDEANTALACFAESGRQPGVFFLPQAQCRYAAAGRTDTAGMVFQCGDSSLLLCLTH